MTLNRIEPGLPPTAMQTFAVAAPLTSGRHWRKASCREVDCHHWREGWATVFDETNDTGRGRAQYVRNVSGRRFRESRTEAGLTRFDFSPGQTCFASGDHTIRN